MYCYFYFKEFEKQSIRAQRLFMDVVAGVIYSEITVMHRYDNFIGVDPSPGDIGLAREGYTASFIQIKKYFYKALYRGIPREPTMSRFKAGLELFSIPRRFCELYDAYLENLKGHEVHRLYQKMHCTNVDADTGNFASFHDTCTEPEIKENHLMENNGAKYAVLDLWKPNATSTPYNTEGSNNEETTICGGKLTIEEDEIEEMGEEIETASQGFDTSRYEVEEHDSGRKQDDSEKKKTKPGAFGYGTSIGMFK